MIYPPETTPQALPSKMIQDAFWVLISDTKMALEYKSSKIAFVKYPPKGLISWSVEVKPRYVIGKGNKIYGRAENLGGAMMIVETLLLSVGYQQKQIFIDTEEQKSILDEDEIDGRFANIELD